MQLNYRPCGIVCVGFGWLVGLRPSDISWRPSLVVIYAIMYWPINLTTVQFWLFDLGQLPVTNNTQTKHMQLAIRLRIRFQVQPTYIYIYIYIGDWFIVVIDSYLLWWLIKSLKQFTKHECSSYKKLAWCKIKPEITWSLKILWG